MEKQYSEEQSAIYFVGPCCGKDYISSGKSLLFTEGDGKFNSQISFNRREEHGVSIDFFGSDEKEYTNYLFAFYSPKGQVLIPGIYKNATRFPFNSSNEPGLSISGCGRGCNRLKGEFEILEILRGEKGKLISFAANFLQRCDGEDPLIGTLRYNSSYPISTYFLKHFETYDNKSESDTIIVNMVQKDSRGDEILSTTILNQSNGQIKINNLISRMKGLSIEYDCGQYNKWYFTFAMPEGEELKTGFYNAIAYPLNSVEQAGIALECDDYAVSVKNARFNILELIKDLEGNIISIAVEFSIATIDDLFFQGEIIYKSGQLYQSHCPNRKPNRFGDFETTSDWIQEDTESSSWEIKFDDFT